MPWFKIDDGFWSHPKTLQLSDGAQALWMRAGSWSMHHLTDGFVPDFALPILSAKPRFVEELRAVSLWVPAQGGNQFHDWSKYQPTKEQVESDRLAAAERKRVSRERSQRDTQRDTRTSHSKRPPSPTRPDPTVTTTDVVVTQFEQFWQAWPRKVARPKAQESFAKALQIASFTDIMAGVLKMQEYATARGDLTFIPHPTTWLNQQRWSDDVAMPVQPTGPVDRFMDAVALGAQMRAESEGHQIAR